MAETEIELRPQWRKFADEYCRDFNGTQAAIRAGYSPNGAGVQAHHLLRKPNIRAHISARLEAEGMTTGEVVQKLAGWARGSIAPFHRIDAEATWWWT